MSDSKYVRLKLSGSSDGDRKYITAPGLSITDADTGKAIRATKIHLFADKGLIFAEVTVFLSEIDVETKAEKVVLCRRCQREQSTATEVLA